MREGGQREPQHFCWKGEVGKSWGGLCRGEKECEDGYSMGAVCVLIG